MLATLLPGLRNVRTPLATGYLYFLAAWLLLGPSRLIPDTSDAGAVGRLAQLVDAIGSTATFTALTFAAYLFGSIVQIKSWPFGISPKGKFEFDIYGVRSDSDEDDGFYDDFYDTPSPDRQFFTESWAEGLLGWADEVVDETGDTVTYRQLADTREFPRRFYSDLEAMWNRARGAQLERLETYQIWEQRGAKLNKMSDDLFEAEKLGRQELLALDSLPADAYEKSGGRLYPDEHHPFWHLGSNIDEPVPREHLQQVFESQMDDELELVTARLRAQDEHVFDETDRLGTEAELRYSIVPPLVIIAVTAAITWQWWAIALLVLPAVLLRQAYTIERDSVIEVLAAIQYGNVASPTADALRNALHSTSRPPDSW